MAETETEITTYSPSNPPSSTSTRDTATLDGRPTTANATAMLRQLDVDREQSTYWRARWADDHSDQAIEAWLRSLLDWLTRCLPSPFDSASPRGPVEGRAAAEIRADLAALAEDPEARLDVQAKQHAARLRLLRDVPQLLAEVEAAHRFERSVAVDSARLAAVEALVEQARKVSPSDSMTVYVGDLEWALGRRSRAVRGIVGAEA